MAKDESSSMTKLLAIAVAASLLFLSSAATNFQANAQQASSDEEDPHTETTGTMEITTETTDNHTQTTYIFTSDDLKKKYGYSTLMRVVEHHLQEGESAPADEKKVEKNVKMKIVHESETDKLDRYQKAKNNGIPMNSYLKWDVVEPVNQDSDGLNETWNPILALLRFFGIIQMAEATHVQAWAHKQAAYSPYDPINLIWKDTAMASSDVIAAAGSKLNGNGWSSVSNCLYATDLYVLVDGAYKRQTGQHFKYPTGSCDGEHVRTWRITADVGIGSAHREVVDGTTGDIRHIAPQWNFWENSQLFGHRVTSFENGETTVMNTFDLPSLTCWDTLPNSHLMSNSYTREYWNDARTTKIGSAISGQYATEINQINC